MSVATLAPTTAGTVRLVRRLPVPQCEPPFDDERPLESRATDVVGAVPLPFDPATTRRLRLVPDPPAEQSELALFAPRRTPRAELPDPRGWGARLTQALTEVLDGHRPIGQLLRWLSEDVYEEVEAMIFRAAATSARSAGQADVRVRPERTVVRSVHVCEPDDGVAELSAVVRRAARSTAVALRLEGYEGRWLCTALQH